MNRAVKIFSGALASAAILMSFCANSGVAAAREKFKYVPFVPSDPIMPLSEVKPGMKGECYTVVKGSDVVSFQAEVIDIIPNGGNPKNLILVRVSGKAVEETGIAAGMSGSPFYIKNRLVGAIGYGWSFTDHEKGLVTPIEEMMEIWNNPEIIPSFAPAAVIAEAPPSASGDVDAPGKRDAIVSGDETPGGVIIEEVLPASGDIVTSRDKTTSRDIGISSGDSAGGIFVTGVSRRMADRITGLIGENAVPFGGSPDGARMPVRYNVPVKPGMSIGAMALWGDVEIGSVGTLTAVSKDGRFIAYAHPFMNLGPTAAVLTDARISNVISSMNNPFKIGHPENIIGIVTQDRPQGIGGRLGQFAPAASVVVNLSDIDSGRSYRKAFQIVQDKYLLSNLASPAIVGCIEDLWGRVGAGSAKVVASYSGGAILGGWKRTNIFISDTDVASQMLEEFRLMTQMFAVNQFQEIRPFGIDVDVEITQEPRALYIEDVVVPKGPFHPGELVSFDITLRPWRKDPFVRTYSLTVPENVSGIAQLLVRGGGIAEEDAEYLHQAWRSISSLPILLKELDAKETNDQIVMEIRGEEALDEMINRARKGDPDDLMNDKLKSEIRDEKMREGSMRVVRTNYYVDGIIHKLIKVEGSLPEEGE
ncbi:MAG: hypothetical protein LBS53_11605 [Synergistaceae bacterium]|jgi:hypothetical protein|nr:hypothetical protein [Synergistaceae bacterium]